ncbi:hypothetical protein Taro_036667, partial [Colocasia esculenta]|nr:hypothetical protein [Colocasia esculenta]
LLFRGKKQKFIQDGGSASDVALLSKSMAEKVQSELDPSLPSFVKPMKHSHVTGGFWLGLPKEFCQLLPENDCTIVLQDEDGKEFETVYLARRTGLSGGWRGFSIAHQLVAEDALIFQLLEPTRLKHATCCLKNALDMMVFCVATGTKVAIPFGLALPILPPAFAFLIRNW